MSRPILFPEEAGKLLALIQCELNLSTKAMSNQLGITDVWMRGCSTTTSFPHSTS